MGSFSVGVIVFWLAVIIFVVMTIVFRALLKRGGVVGVTSIAGGVVLGFVVALGCYWFLTQIMLQHGARL